MKQAEGILQQLEAEPTPKNIRMISAATGEPPYTVKRRLMAAAVAGGATVEDVAETFAVTITRVRAACVSHGVKLPEVVRVRVNNPYTPNYKIIAAILRESKGGKLAHGKGAEIAKQFSCTRQNVLQMFNNMKKNGIFEAARFTK